MRLSTSTCSHEFILWDFDEMFYTCEDSICAIAKAGFEVFDMNFASYSRGTLPMTQDDWEDWVKRQHELALELELDCSQSHAHFYDWRIDPKDVAYHEELIRRSIIGAGIMQADWLVIHPGQVEDGVGYSYKKSLEKNLEVYKGYAEFAAKHGVKIAIENMIEGRERRYCGTLDELLELHDRLDDPLFGICWDTGHAHLSHLDQAASLREIGPRLKAMHVADNRGELDDHVAPYFGHIQWEPIMKTLAEIDYQGDFTYEIQNFFNGIPHGMHDQLLRFSYELGNFMIDMAYSNQ